MSGFARDAGVVPSRHVHHRIHRRRNAIRCRIERIARRRGIHRTGARAVHCRERRDPAGGRFRHGRIGGGRPGRTPRRPRRGRPREDHRQWRDRCRGDRLVHRFAWRNRTGLRPRGQTLSLRKPLDTHRDAAVETVRYVREAGVLAEIRFNRHFRSAAYRAEARGRRERGRSGGDDAPHLPQPCAADPRLREEVRRAVALQGVAFLRPRLLARRTGTERAFSSVPIPGSRRRGSRRPGRDVRRPATVRPPRGTCRR